MSEGFKWTPIKDAGFWFPVRREHITTGMLKSPNKFILWMYLLSKVAHEPKVVELMDEAGLYGKETLYPGQCLFGLTSASRHTGLTARNLRSALSALISTGWIKRKVAGRYSIITIQNYEGYALREEKERQGEGGEQRQGGDRVATTYKNKKNRKNSSSCPESHQSDQSPHEPEKEKPSLKGKDQTPKDSDEKKLSIEDLSLTDQLKQAARKGRGNMYLTDGKLQRAFEQFQEYYSGSQLRPLKEWIKLWEDWCGNRKHWPEPKKMKNEGKKPVNPYPPELKATPEIMAFHRKDREIVDRGNAMGLKPSDSREKWRDELDPYREAAAASR